MKNPLLFVLLSLTTLYGCNAPGRNGDHASDEGPSMDTSYDSLKARAYGADEYGMKKYVMAFLYRGSNTDVSPEEDNELQMAHLRNITKMAEEGKLVLAGPFFGGGALRGIYIFNVDDIEAAERLTSTDPAIEAGSLRMELVEWYGSAALMAVNDVHQTIAKKGIVEE